MDNDKRIAVLIDADNVSGKYIQPILNEVSNYGTPTYKRIYGDWTKPQLASWKKNLLNYSITPIQQYSYTVGKNSTDAALIIDAMDILYSGNVDGFCIVSSDSDFTRLASRLREAGMYVIGMGEQKTPAPFRVAVEKFIYLEVLTSGEDEKESGDTEAEKTDSKSKSKSNVMSTRRLVNVLKAIISELSDDEGWAHLSAVGNVLNRRHPDFDTRNYGYAKMSTLMKSLKQFEVQSRNTGDSHQTPVYVRVK
ncbi:NYN domain-containing protein [Christensenellaceae bacterium OttesenSCG-928-K19]|nr:NYN domain-containing protein [Christensenellaceae bacterium OttesenSCG-928-K19]